MSNFKLDLNGLTCLSSTLTIVKYRKLRQTKEFKRPGFLVLTCFARCTSKQSGRLSWSCLLAFPPHLHLSRCQRGTTAGGCRRQLTGSCLDAREHIHTQPLAKLWNIFVNFCFQVSEGKCIHVPVGCQARFRTTDFNTNCPVFCHWQFTFLKIKIKTIFQKVNNDEVGQDLSNHSSPPSISG